MDKVCEVQEMVSIQFDWKKIVLLCIKSRKKQKLSIEALSKISGVSNEVLLDFEDGLTNLTIETLFKIISPLDIRLNSSHHLSFLNWEYFVSQTILRRKAFGITLQDMQLSASISYKVIKKFEAADKTISLNQLLPILKALNISQSRRFNKRPDRDNYVRRQKVKYGSSSVPEVPYALLDWIKITKLCTRIRQQLNLNQADLAAKAGVSRPTIVNFESGLTKINMASVFKIFDALSLDKNLSTSDRSDFFSILAWEEFIKIVAN